ncbi:MAG: T9SS type A sorting domain-containing protein [Candidatus Methylacidiphilales bacterium]
MKKMYLLGLMVLCYVFSIAQNIPNGGFENWTTTGNYTDPNGWFTFNATFSSANTFTVEKGTPGATGNSYAKITSKRIGDNLFPGALLMGSLVNNEVIPGMAINTKPAFLLGKYQSKIGKDDTALVIVQFTKWNNLTNTRELEGIGILDFIDLNTDTWTEFIVSMDYIGNITPDSCSITIILGNAPPAADNFFAVDDLIFSNTLNSINDINAITTQVYPNPNDGKFTINSTANMSYIQITNILGEVVFSENINGNSVPITLNNLATGLYFYSINTIDNKVIIGKILIN